MNYVFIDEETGESLDRAASQGSCYRSSTLNFTDDENNNVETGEPEEAGKSRLSRRVPFQIPRALQRQELEEDEDEDLRVFNKKCVDKKENKYLLKMKEYAKTQPFGQANPIMLCIPIIIYYPWVISIIMCFELLIHAWAHNKNKHLRNSDVYYRSPLNPITSEFCTLCQDETCMDRVGKMQAIRADKFLRQCNYMKRVVT